MKKAILLLSALMLLTTAQNVVKAQDLTLSDVQNSGCLRDSEYGRRRANETEERRTMILLKEGNILTVQLFNFEATCETEDFIITPKVNNGDPCFVSINVDYIDSDADCICPYNISFTLHDLEPNCFFFSCWWYEGQVNLIEGEPLTLESITEHVTIDGFTYIIEKVSHTATFISADVEIMGLEALNNLVIPSDVDYEGQKYIVTSIGELTLLKSTLTTSVTIPSSVTSIGYYAFTNCPNLTDVYCYAEGVPSTGDDVFKGTPIASATLHVPAGSIEEYKATSPWNKFGNIVGIAQEGPIKDITRYFSYFMVSPESQYETMNLWYQRKKYVAADRKEYLQYGGYFREDSIVDAMVLLRQEEAKCFCYDTNTNTEHLLFDFGLQKGDSYYDDLNNLEYEVTDVRDTIVNNERLCLIELMSQDGRRDIWLEGCGSIYTGILKANASCGDVCLLRAGEIRFYPNNQFVKTADANVTQLVWEGKLETPEDWEAYEVWYGAPSDLNAEFVDDTLHVWGRLHTYCDIIPYAICGLREDQIDFMLYSNGDVDCYNNYEIDVRIPGFQRGSYEVQLHNKTVQIECIAAERVPHQPQSFLEGNPIWVYKYEHMPEPEDLYFRCWLNTGDRYFTYYFLGGKKEIEGKVYTMMGEVTSNGEEELRVNRWLPVREDNGIVYTITDSLPGVVEHCYDDEYYPLPYLQQGNECVLYNFNTEIGETLYPQNKWGIVESYDTYQLMDGTVCRVLKTTSWGYYDLYEKLGYVIFEPEYGVMDPLCGMLVPTNGHVYINRLNAYYQDNVMLYKAADAPDGLCVNDTCWTRNDAEAYAVAYKADPYHEKVMSFIRQLQGLVDPVTFTAGQMATIILPETPDAGMGKFYRLDRVDGREIIFEQELQPQAHVPYIIVPSEDFSIDLSTLDLEGLRSDTVSIEVTFEGQAESQSIYFIGSYVSEELEQQEGCNIQLIDTTPDCSISFSEETGKGAFLIGALRAYLTWDDPIDHGGAKGRGDMEIVLRDYGTDIKTHSNSPLKGENKYDLSGRKIVNGKWHGIYIENGQKRAK